ncbi:carbohydrate binding domain-containing protein [Candidatus Poribacteria bacterium]
MRFLSLRRLMVVLHLLVFSLMVGVSVHGAGIENIARNGDFEEGIVEWELRQSGDSVGEIREDNIEAINGDLCVFIDIASVAGTSAWHMALFQDGHTIEQDKVYTLAVWLKGEEPRPVTLYAEEQAAPWTGHGRTDFEITQEWQEYWITFTAPITFAVWLRVTLGLSDVNLWADNVRFYEGAYVEDAGTVSAINPAGRLLTTWAGIRLSY